jgi:hypothetical protein
MNHIVAYKLLADELLAYRQLPVDEIRQLVGEHSTRLVRGKDSVDYSLTVVVRSRSGDDVRVVGFIGIADWGSPHDSLNEVISIKST